MNQEVITLIGTVALAMLVFFIFPFIALMVFIKKRTKVYEESAAFRRKNPSKSKQLTIGLETDYTWRRWKVIYVIAALLIVAGVFIGAGAYNNQRVCEGWSRGDIGGSSTWDRYSTGSTCKTLAERSEGINAAGLTGLVAVILAAGWLALPWVYRYTSPNK